MVKGTLFAKFATFSHSEIFPRTVAPHQYGCITMYKAYIHSYPTDQSDTGNTFMASQTYQTFMCAHGRQ